MQKLENDHPTEKEIGLLDIFRFISEGRNWIFSGIFAGAALGAIYSFVAEEQYEATATMEVATVAGSPIEAPAVLVEKLKLPLYYSSATLKTCNPENNSPFPGEGLAKRLEPSINKNAPYINIKFRAPSTAEAQQCLEAVLTDIRRDQSGLFKPIFDLRKSQLDVLKKRLEAAENLAAILPLGPARGNPIDQNSPVSALSLAMLTTQESEIRDLRTRVNEMQVSLMAPKTREAALVTPIYAPSSKVEPKRSVIVLSSIFIGMFLGIVLFGVRKITLP